MCHVLQTIYIVEAQKNKNQTFRFVLEVFELLVGTIGKLKELHDDILIYIYACYWPNNRE